MLHGPDGQGRWSAGLRAETREVCRSWHSKAEAVVAEVGADMGGGGPSWAAGDRETGVRDGGAAGKPSWVKRSRGSMWAHITSSELTDAT